MSFADNSSTNSTELIDELLLYSGGTFEITVIFLTLFQVVLFPFYAYLNIVNQPQDSQRPVFQFLNFFFKIMCIAAVGYNFTTVYVAVVVIEGRTYSIRDQYSDFQTINKFSTDPSYDFIRTPLFLSGSLIAFLNFVATVINMPVCQLLTSILAFHRFLLYFSPTIGDFLTPGKKAAKILICLLYAVVLVGMVITAGTGSGGLEEFGKLFNASQISVWNATFHIYYYVGLGLSELLISIPYTFMILSIRKLTNLASAIQSRPEKYIAYQIIITFVLKLISFLNVFSDLYSKRQDLAKSVEMFLANDILVFPLAVQLAYILSNKKNVDTLIEVITGKVMFWKNRARVEVESSTRF